MHNLAPRALPAVGEALRAANALTGVVSHLSAAQHWGWEVTSPPSLPHVTVPRQRRIERDRRRRVAEALAVADSALRHGAVTPSGLVALAAPLRGPGSAVARRVAAAADARAANPFESVLRSICLNIRGLRVVPQLTIGDPGFRVRPDLVDVDLGLVLEADSHTWHSSRAALRRDCQRYNGLVLRGWTVLRFAWEDVLLEPERARADLTRFVEQARRPGRGRSAR